MAEEKDVGKVFDLFIEEVSLTYGQQIAECCQKKLSLLDSVDKVDEMKILDEAKAESGFDPEKSSLYYAHMRFNMTVQ